MEGLARQIGQELGKLQMKLMDLVATETTERHIESEALRQLLIDKGIISEDEFQAMKQIKAEQGHKIYSEALDNIEKLVKNLEEGFKEYEE